MSRENVEIVRATVDAYNRGDLDAALKDAAPGCVLDNSRLLGEYRGGHRGLEQIRSLWQGFAEPWESLREEIDEAVDVGESVVTHQTTYFRGRDGIEVSAHTSYLWTFGEGLVVRVVAFRERAEALEAAGLSR